MPFGLKALRLPRQRNEDLILWGFSRLCIGMRGAKAFLFYKATWPSIERR
ncbi:hypothetical protein ARMA_0115 [Ardenticatena maritima]|uniref:Uncharacterized protein n=1 Tax=Ardenticatena maritima TaxID=872965 RepID=A0A0M8K6F9_9CHLR|nr:hypothetical protein ARMA_0115 [Ardenticatena maritima]